MNKVQSSCKKGELRLQNQAKLRSSRTSPMHKFGHDVPRNNDYEHAVSIDKKNGNTKWADCIKLEIDQQHQCDTCKDIETGQAPKDYKKIHAHFVFDVKYDGRHKSILVADMHLTDVLL